MLPTCRPFIFNTSFSEACGDQGLDLYPGPFLIRLQTTVRITDSTQVQNTDT